MVLDLTRWHTASVALVAGWAALGVVMGVSLAIAPVIGMAVAILFLSVPVFLTVGARRGHILASNTGLKVGRILGNVAGVVAGVLIFQLLSAGMQTRTGGIAIAVVLVLIFVPLCVYGFIAALKMIRKAPDPAQKGGT